MPIYLTVEVLIESVGAALILFAISLLFIEWKRHQDQIVLSLFFTQLNLFIMVFLDIISILIQSKTLFQVKLFFSVPLAVLLELTLSKILIGRFNIFRIVLATFISSVVFFTALLPEYTVYYTLPNGQPSIGAVGVFRVTYSIFAIYIAVTYLVYSILLYINSPPDLKKAALIHFVGAMFIGPVTNVFFILFNWAFPGSFSIPMALGAIFMAYAITSSPAILYALPFRAYRLLLVQAGSGLVLYSYHWVQPEKASELAAALLESINQYANFNLAFGRIRVIEFDNGAILSSPVFEGKYYVFVESNVPTKSLRQGISRFVSLIEQNYPILNKSFSAMLSKQTFAGVKELIQTSFPYLYQDPELKDLAVE